MNQAALFGGGERGHDLIGNAHHRSPRQGAGSLHSLLERFALNQLHSVKALARLFLDPEVIDGRHIFVSQRRGRAGAAHETFARRRTARVEFRLDDL